MCLLNQLTSEACKLTSLPQNPLLKYMCSCLASFSCCRRFNKTPPRLKRLVCGSNTSFSYTCCVFLVKNLILHANSYKDPSRYQVQLCAFAFAVRFEPQKLSTLCLLSGCSGFHQTCLSESVAQLQFACLQCTEVSGQTCCLCRKCHLFFPFFI